LRSRDCHLRATVPLHRRNRRQTAIRSARRCFRGAARLEQKPGAPLGLVDPYFQQTRRCNIAVLVAYAVRFTHPIGEPAVVFTQFGEHVEGRDVVGVIVQDSLEPSHLPD